MAGYHCALRFSEAFHLYGNELQVFREHLEIDVRSHGCHTLKTEGSNGRVAGLLKLTKLEVEALKFLQSRAIHLSCTSTYLFHGTDSDYWGGEVSRVRSLLRRAFQGATGRADMRFHAFRHTAANHRAIVMWAPEYAAEWIGLDVGKGELNLDSAITPGGAQQHRRTLALRRALRHADEATTFAHYIHCAHILYGARMRKVVWPRYPDEYLNAVTAGKVPTNAALTDLYRRKAPPGFDSVKMVGQARRKRLPGLSESFADLTLSHTLALLMRTKLPSMPSIEPSRRIARDTVESAYRHALALKGTAQIFSVASKVTLEQLLAGNVPFISKREYIALDDLARELDDGAFSTKGLAQISRIGLPIIANDHLRWYVENQSSAAHLLEFLRFLGANPRNLAIYSAVPSAIDTLLDRFGLKLNLCVAERLLHARLSISDGIIIELENMEELRLRGREDIQIILFANAVFQRVQAETYTCTKAA